jgi:hypothetical protein
MKLTSPAAVAAQIAQLEERLGRLRRLQGAIAGGDASGIARQQPDRDERIRSYYLQRKGEYGVVKKIAAAFGLSERQVRRILRIGGIDRDTATDAPSRDPPAGSLSKPPSTPRGAPSRSDDRGIGTASRAANSTEPDSRLADETDDPAVVSPEEFFNRARHLINSMFRQANEARIPGHLQIDREAALRSVESFAGKWEELVGKLWRGFVPRWQRPPNRKPPPHRSHKRTRTN